MDSRPNLQTMLETLSDELHVYFQPPTSTKIIYPAIVYFRNSFSAFRGDNISYGLFPSYTITLKSRNPEDPILKKLLSLPYITYDRHYVVNNIHNDVLTIFYK